eukprot:2471368-Pleurochrysis_carterae.AAC.1
MVPPHEVAVEGGRCALKSSHETRAACEAARGTAIGCLRALCTSGCVHVNLWPCLIVSLCPYLHFCAGGVV